MPGFEFDKGIFNNPKDYVRQRLDDQETLPGGSREEYFRVLNKRPGALAQVDEVLKDVNPEYQMDMAYELMNEDTPGGFGPDPEGTDPEVYQEQEMSTGATIVDILAKLTGGFAAGMGERGRGNPAMAAQRYVRNLQDDQGRREASRRQSFESDRRAKADQREEGREEQRFQFEISEAERKRDAAERVNNFETPVAGSLVSNAALPQVRAALVLED